MCLLTNKKFESVFHTFVIFLKIVKMHRQMHNIDTEVWIYGLMTELSYLKYQMEHFPHRQKVITPTHFFRQLINARFIHMSD